MGSPYFVHHQVNRTHVVRSAVGFERILLIVARTMGLSTATEVAECSPEWVVLNDLRVAHNTAMTTRSRSVVFLEARYEWRGWEKFQRVIIFDFTSK